MNDARSKGLQAFAVLTAAATLCLILAGGFVTTTKTGDTISGWPFLWGKIEPGFPIEFAHRIAAMVVGVLVAILAAWTFAVERRSWVKKVVLIALAGVIVQAAIGGLRIYIPRATVSIIHACFGQVVFCAVSSIALFLSKSWSEARVDDRAAAARRLGTMTTAFAFLQLVAGAVTRHTGSGIAIHLIGAFLVIFHAAIFSGRLTESTLKGGAGILLGLVGVQVILGFAAWGITTSGFVRSHESPVIPILTISSHVAVGASVLLTSFLLTLRCYRAAGPVEAQAVPA